MILTIILLVVGVGLALWGFQRRGGLGTTLGVVGVVLAVLAVGLLLGVGSSHPGKSSGPTPIRVSSS